MPISKSEAGFRGAAARARTYELRTVAMLSARNEELALLVVTLERELAAADAWKLKMAERIVALEHALEKSSRQFASKPIARIVKTKRGR